MNNYVDIIIVNYNTLKYLKNCLESIKTQTTYPYRLLIIDNNSQDGSKAFLKSLNQGDVSVILNGQNLGCAKAWNQGIKMSKGKYILFLNPDTIVNSGWLTSMVECAESDSQIAVVGNKQVNEYGRIIHAGVVYENGTLVYRGYGEQNDSNKYNQVWDCVDVCGACYLIKRSIIQKIGLFDERFFMYAEETDYSYRAREKGFRVVYCPVTIIHYKDGSPISDQKRQTLHMRSRKLFEQKWGGSIREG